MRALLLCVLLVAGCSKKSETKKEEPAKPTTEAPQVPDEKPTEAKPAEDKPAESKPAPPAEAVKIDCTTIVTPDDIAKACGGKKVEIVAGKQEGTGAMFTCQRTITEAGKKGPIAYWFLRGTGKAGEGAAMAKIEKTKDAKPLAGVGDEAYTSEKEQKALKMTDYDVGVTKGGFFFKVSETKDSMTPKPPCTLDQMTELAKVAVSRLP
jgi:hypothetical protein